MMHGLQAVMLIEQSLQIKHIFCIFVGETQKHQVWALKANKVMWVFIRLFLNSSQRLQAIVFGHQPWERDHN